MPGVQETLSTALILAFTLGGTAHWITPDFPEGQEPDYRPVPLYWFKVKGTPYVYRRIIEVRDGLKFAVAEARSSGYLYLFVDGKPVFEYVPSKGEEGEISPPLHLDLTPYLAPGRHAIAVSAPREGFAIDGVIRYRGEVEPLVTDGSWRVMKFPPTTVIEDEPWMLPTFEGKGVPVKEGEPFKSETDFEHMAMEGLARRTALKYDDILWRLGLLAHKGIVIKEGVAYGCWAGASRLNPTLLEEAKRLYIRMEELMGWVDRLRGDLGDVPPDEIASLAEEIGGIAERTEVLSLKTYLLDELKALRLADGIIGADLPGDPLNEGMKERILDAEDIERLKVIAMRLEGCRGRLTDAWGHPLNVLNESRYDRLGWIPHPDLVDGQIASWGLRVNPILAPTTIKMDGKWRFSADPEEVGETEKRHTVGYNIENQWPRINVPGSWNEVKEYRDYRGTAWYRTRVHVPEGWRGHDVVLRFQVNDADKVWVNDVLIGSEDKSGVRNYVIGKEIIRPGAENAFAFKVTGHGRQRGIVGSVTLSCPDLIGQKAEGPTAKLLSTPLSPAVILTLDGTTLEIRGWAERGRPGPAQIVLPSDEGLVRTRDYRSDRDGGLPSNWVILWMSLVEGEPDRPVMLVFEKAPLRITDEGDFVRITFGEPNVRMVAVRPWVREVPEVGSDRFYESVRFWSRAALAVPVNYMELTRMIKSGPPADFPFDIRNVPDGPVLEHTIIYDYLILRDDWDTEPLKVAPVPALCSYAIDCDFRDLRFTGLSPETVQDGGLLSPYRAVMGRDRIVYSYSIEPFPRLAGFTSWMFSHADTGVPGNEREVELLKTTGANSYRPQHNFCTERSPYFPEDETRTRLQIMVDYCNRHGMNYMNNIDQTLGKPRQFVREHYDIFMELVNKHYELIAYQLRDRPFLYVAYDLINEPFDHKHEAYNKAMKVLTRRVRAVDPVHLLYIEPCEAWGAIEKLAVIEPTGDPLTVYSFHDYNFRLFKPADRWPTQERDISNIYRHWTEAFKFAIKHGAAMHCGEFGGFHNSTDNQIAQLTLMNDFFRIFDQFGMHFHYYSGRTVFGRRADGSMTLSNVVRAYRRYFRRREFNLYYR